MLQRKNRYRVRYGPTRLVLRSAQSSTSFVKKAAPGRSNEVSVMSTAEAIMRRTPPLPLLAFATGALLLQLSSPVFADGGCGPLRGGGTGLSSDAKPRPTNSRLRDAR